MRRAALRPTNETSVPVRSQLPGLSRPRYLAPRATLSPGLRQMPACVGPAFTGKLSDDRRARVLGPSEGRVPSAPSSVQGCVAFECARGRRSPPRRPRDTRCRRRARSKGEKPIPSATDRPRPSFLRRPTKGDDIQTIRVPSTVAIASGLKDRSFRLLASVSRSRRPHVFPGLGRVLFRALQARDAE